MPRKAKRAKSIKAQKPVQKQAPVPGLRYMGNVGGTEVYAKRKKRRKRSSAT